ncbi:MAG: hypothetical protein BRD30_10365, partial [Bacteroidetes bacterium QH_2_63_10]
MQEGVLSAGPFACLGQALLKMRECGFGVTETDSGKPKGFKKLGAPGEQEKPFFCETGRPRRMTGTQMSSSGPVPTMGIPGILLKGTIEDPTGRSVRSRLVV